MTREKTSIEHLLKKHLILMLFTLGKLVETIIKIWNILAQTSKKIDNL